MLSEEAKREFQELARSSKLREDFELLRAMARQAEEHLTPTQLIRFLTDMNRAFGSLSPPRPFVPYVNIRL